MIQRWARGDTVGLGGAESLNQVKSQIFADWSVVFALYHLIQGLL